MSRWHMLVCIWGTLPRVPNFSFWKRDHLKKNAYGLVGSISSLYLWSTPPTAVRVGNEGLGWDPLLVLTVTGRGVEDPPKYPCTETWYSMILPEQFFTHNPLPFQHMPKDQGCAGWENVFCRKSILTLWTETGRFNCAANNKTPKKSRGRRLWFPNDFLLSFTLLIYTYIYIWFLNSFMNWFSLTSFEILPCFLQLQWVAAKPSISTICGMIFSLPDPPWNLIKRKKIPRPSTLLGM